MLPLPPPSPPLKNSTILEATVIPIPTVRLNEPPTLARHAMPIATVSTRKQNIYKDNGRYSSGYGLFAEGTGNSI